MNIVQNITNQTKPCNNNMPFKDQGAQELGQCSVQHNQMNES